MKIMLTGVVCLAMVCLGVPYLAVPCLAQQLKEGEFDPYNLAVKDLNANDFAKALQDLDAWKAKFPASDYADIRTAFYVQAYTGLNQPDKTLGAARELLARDLKTLFHGPTGQAMTIRLLYNATWAISHSVNPDPEDLAAGEKAARELMAYEQPLPGVSAEQWAQARADMKDKAASALVYIAMLPGVQAMAKRPPDCAAAEAVYTKALAEYPTKGAISYELGRALNCQSKIAAAVFEFQRAVVIEPAMGEKIRSFADNAYIKVHGSDEGLAQLKDRVKASPLPPEGFSIKTSAEIADEKEKDFNREHPELAAWRTIRESLSGDKGVAFLESQLKDAEMPKLKGTLIEVKPACRPRELYVAMDGDKAEVLLKLPKPVAGRPQLNAEIEWEGGVGSAFTSEPFLFTMTADSEKVQGLKLSPCAPGRK